MALSQMGSVAYAEPSNGTFSIDGFSFFYSVDVSGGGTVPTVSVPIHVSQTTPGSAWTFSIEPSDLDLPPIVLPNGTSVEWSLMTAGTGQIAAAGPTASVSFAGQFLSESVETTRRAEHQLAFTTGLAQAAAGGAAVSREGITMDLASGYVQLVAAGVDPPGSTNGVPFYVVISGHIQSAAAGL